MTDQKDYIVIKQRKSQVTGFVLTFLFGPLGLLYATPLGCLIMVLLAIVVGFFTLGLGALIAWPISIIWSIVAISISNSATHKPNAPVHRAAASA